MTGNVTSQPHTQLYTSRKSMILTQLTLPNLIPAVPPRCCTTGISEVEPITIFWGGGVWLLKTYRVKSRTHHLHPIKLSKVLCILGIHIWCTQSTSYNVLR